MKEHRSLSARLIKTLGLGALALGAPAFAEQSAGSKFVDNVALDFPGMAVVIHVKNTSANKHVDFVSLAAQETKMDFKISGTVYCDPGTNVLFKGAHAYFGNVALGGFGQLSTTGTLHTESASVAYLEKKNDPVEYTEDTFSVPLNKVKNGAASLVVDPLAEINKKLQAHLQGGGKAVDFYRNDQDIVLQRPISLAGICGNNSENTVGYRTKNHAVQIKYEGDNKVFQNAQLNAQLGNQMPNQLANNLPYQLDKADFQANIPDYVGKCEPNSNPKIRVNLQGSGSEQGQIDLRVAAVSNTYGAYGNYFETSGIMNNPQNGGSHVDFYFPLKEMLSQDKYSYMTQPNKTWNHNMRVEARYKNAQNGTWSAWKNFDTAVFKHRCMPNVNPGLGGNGGIQFNNQNPAPSMNIKSSSNEPKAPMKLNAQPLKPDPKPQLNLKAQPPKPDPKPQLKLQAQPASPEPADQPKRAQ